MPGALARRRSAVASGQSKASVAKYETGYGVEWRWSGTHGASGRPFDVRGASIGRLRDVYDLAHPLGRDADDASA